MLTCLVYDLKNAPPLRYDTIDKALAKAGGAKSFNTTWFFDAASYSPTKAFALLKPHLRPGDKAIAMAIANNASGTWVGLDAKWSKVLERHL